MTSPNLLETAAGLPTYVLIIIIIVALNVTVIIILPAMICILRQMKQYVTYVKFLMNL